MKKALIALCAIGLATPAFAQNAQMPPGASNGPPGTGYSGQQTPALPNASTGTAKPNSLGNAASAEESAARYKLEQHGFTSVRGLSRSPDGVWSGRAVKDGIEVAVSMDAAGNIAQQ